MRHQGFLEAFRTAGERGSARSIEPPIGSLPAPSGGFLFATGIECSAPTISNGRIRRDLLQECGHYARWKEDLALVRDLGLRFLRYGLPYHRVHVGPGDYDWEFADAVMQEMRRLDITPILDLMHFGVPDWLGDFQNPELPLHFAEYAAAVARRYPWVRYYTPVNEMYVTARISAKDGLWNEQLTTDGGFVTALKHLVAANILASHSIVEVRRDAILIPSESAEFVHEARLAQSVQTTSFNQHRFLSLDLLYARPFDADTRTYLFDSGMSPSEYNWFMSSPRSGHQVLGIDYYGRNEHLVTPAGRRIPVDDVMGFYVLGKEYYDRYRKPLMHTETNVLEAADGPGWLWKQWLNVLRMRQDGIPVLGFTWYSLVDQVDWDIALTEKRGRVNGCGLYDLDRRPNPVAHEYRALLAEYGQLCVMPHGPLFELTGLPASSAAAFAAPS
jgi:beta-glucosidase/6-phospho-beta-glucosidase/beta-galactosidase